MAYWRSPPFMPSPQHRVRLHDLGSDYRLSSRSAARRRIGWGMEIVHARPDAVARRTSRFNHGSGPEICFRGWAVAGIWGPHCFGGPERSPSSHGPLDGPAFNHWKSYNTCCTMQHMRKKRHPLVLSLHRSYVHAYSGTTVRT
jgi:hypothetical protein